MWSMPVSLKCKMNRLSTNAFLPSPFDPEREVLAALEDADDERLWRLVRELPDEDAVLQLVAEEAPRLSHRQRAGAWFSELLLVPVIERTVGQVIANRASWNAGEQCFSDAVRAWTGEARALDAAAIAWREPTSIDPATLAPADRPILAALRLPPHYLFSPEGATPDQLAQWIGEALARGARLLQLRFPERPSAVVLDAVAGALSEAHRHGAQVLLHGDVERAVTWGVGVHLDASHLRTLTERPLPLGMLVAASCHDADDLAHAVRVGCDFATLSPVSTGRASSHEPLGWPRFARLAEAASLPIYALGGVGSDDLGEARMHAAQGIAGVC